MPATCQSPTTLFKAALTPVRNTHDFFFERDYPDVTILDDIFARLRSASQAKSALQTQLRMDPDIFDKALEKLWIHGGAVLDFAETSAAARTIGASRT